MCWTRLVTLVACACPAHAQDLTLTATLVVPGKVLDSAVLTVTGGRITGVAEGGAAPEAV